MSELDDKLARMWEKYRPVNSARVAAIEKAAQELEQGALSEPTREEAERVAHMIAGSAGTFGFHAITELAREIELQLEKGATPQPDFVDKVASLRMAMDSANLPKK